MKAMYCIWKYEEFDCEGCILVAQDFLLFYFKKHLHGNKWWIKNKIETNKMNWNDINLKYKKRSKLINLPYKSL